MTDPGPGSVVEGRYRVDGVVELASGRVFRGTALASGRAVGLVVLPPLSAQALRRATLLSHPSLATLRELIPRPAGYALAVFETIEGATLAEVLAARGTLEPARAAAIAAAVADALSALHQRGSAHGLVHLDSVIVGPGLGLSAALTYAPPLAPPSSYLSPERGAGPPSPADDVWGLAATLHSMLIGAPPPVAGYTSRSSVVRAGVLEPALAGLLANCLARRPEQRVTLVAAVRDALVGFRPSPTPAVPSRPPSLGPLARDGSSGAPAAAEPAAILVPEQFSVPRLPSFPAAPEAGGDSTAAATEIGRESGAVALEPPAATPAVGESASPRRRWSWALVAAVALAGAGAVGFWLLGGERSGVAVGPSDATSASAPDRAATADSGVASTATPPSASAAAAGAAPLPVPSPSAGDRAGSPLVVDVAACVTDLTPAGAFTEPPKMDWLCSEPDPRVGYRRMRSALVRSSGGRLNAAMSLWSRLRWYGMAGVAVLRGACCAELTRFELRPTSGCDDTAPILDELARTVADRGALEPVIARYTRSVACQSAAGRAARLGLDEPLGGGEATAFQELVELFLARTKR